MVDTRVRDHISVSEVPLARKFANVFPEVLPGVPPERQVEFRFDLVLGAALIAKASLPVGTTRHAGAVIAAAGTAREVVHLFD